MQIVDVNGLQIAYDMRGPPGAPAIVWPLASTTYHKSPRTDVVPRRHHARP